MPIFSLHPKKKQKSDLELITEYKIHDDLSALDQLFQRYLHLIFFVCEKYLNNVEDSKDAVMEIFEKSIHALKKYDIKNFKSWLYVTAKNHCLKKRKKETDEYIFEENLEELEEIFVENPDFDTLLNERNVQFHKLEAAIDKLNDAQKSCIVLFYLKKNSYREIAEATGYSISQVKSNIQNGKKNLRKLLTKIEAQ